MSEEDQMVQSLIQYHNSDQNRKNITEVNIEPEAHFNHYGDRGVADLFVRKKEVANSYKTYLHDYVYEVKSDKAVKSSTGANEIIRQFNRMRKYFYQDESKITPKSTHFELLFIPTKRTVEHVANNLSLYKSVENKKICEEVESIVGDTNALVCFRTSK